MSYRDMNRLAMLLCGVIAFAVILMIGVSGMDTLPGESSVSFSFQ